MVMPFLYMISTSLKPPNQVFLYPPRWIPNPIVWANYPTAAVRLTALAFLNSVIFTTAIVLGQGLVTTMGGFAFARLKFPGQERDLPGLPRHDDDPVRRDDDPDLRDRGPARLAGHLPGADRADPGAAARSARSCSASSS